MEARVILRTPVTIGLAVEVTFIRATGNHARAAIEVAYGMAERSAGEYR